MERSPGRSSRVRRTRCRLAGISAGLVAAAGWIYAAPAQAVVIHFPGGHVAGVTLRAGVSVPGALTTASRGAGALGAAANGAGTLSSGGGSVLHGTTPYLVFWDPAGAISAHSRGVIERYLTDLAADPGQNDDVFGVLRQYYDTTGYADATARFGGSQTISDTDPFPPPAAAPECAGNTDGTWTQCVSDQEIQNELRTLIGTTLPTGSGPGAPIYLVITPLDVNVCQDSVTCAGGPISAHNVFCAYHSSFTDGSGQVLYTSDPFGADAAAPKGCQFDGSSGNPVEEPNSATHSDLADVVIGDLSHEYSETVTDPFGTAWTDSASGNEVGDNCAFTGAQDPANGYGPDAFLPTLGASTPPALYDQLINGDPYYTQTEWSNHSLGCDAQPAPAALTASFTSAAPVIAGATASFDPTASAAADGFGSESWSFGDGTTAFTTGAPAVQPHVYAAPGTYPVSLTLVDAEGNLATATHPVVALGRPTAAFARTTPSVSGAPTGFDAGGSTTPNPGATVTNYAWSFGDGGTGSGRVLAHSFPTPGNYIVNLTVTDSDGVASSAVPMTVAVTAPPAAAFSVAGPAVARSATAFDASGSTSSSGSLVSYAWSFGDGSSRTVGSAATRHTYAAPGRYAVTLMVTDRFGGTASSTHAVVVLAPGRIARTATRSRGGHVYLLVTVTAAGSVRAGGRTVRLRRPGTASVELPLTAAQQRRRAAHQRVRLRLRVVYLPSVGPPVTTTRTVTFAG